LSGPNCGAVQAVCNLYIKRGKVSVRTYVCNAGRGASDVIMRIAGLVADDTGWAAIGDMWPRVATL